ncbi:tRNA pseudouridine(55) synthase TruB [Zobellia galactanivorans]|uniref:tRNA pseudouridine synthase B n=1 Tax=Zobellia galactanivorans (strain DSM 12802 / CCUG 47099 / CIP 106680 / NCIMB 13871 / Dsij) TaxID=63186 RepID=G0L3P3_ZOBGA|nr:MULTISPECIES: tRNA pseudouridine(55) synthase TruB [Zobellia]MDO6808423.1 tRNA pseudouridine(55) synthase TruB [Zobellia galactanivorans]OWW26441.1 tRNA pseudouridine(55) synthase [Zobellia sp. OII3]CAZ95379.1 tRNA pseudouridine synthase B [Zobellia galactanivorans]
MDSRSKEDFLDGQILLIDKPLGWSSFQAVNKLKWAIRSKFKLKKFKIGHAGTLDPLATGLLIICCGKFTKKIPELQGQVKEYTGTITLGATTPSYDLETEVDQTYPTEHITKALLNETLLQFIGDIEQRPPVFSALKKDGKRLYEYAREGKDVEIKTRIVNVSTFEITQMKLPELKFRIVCSKGTYIRSLAHDLGQALGSGGHLSELRRTKIGEYNVNTATDPNVFAENLLGKTTKS